MLVTTLLTLTLTFTPDASRWSGSLLNQAPKKKTLALPGLQGADIIPAKMDFFTSHFATALAREGLQVTASEDIAAVIGLERQRQLMGCSEGSECMTEIASAIGADALITGKIAKLGNEYGANIRVLDAKTGKAIALFSGTAANEAAVLDLLTLAAKDLVSQLRKLGPGGAVPPPQSSVLVSQPTGLRTFGKWMLIGSGVLLGLGVGTFALALAFGAASDVGITLAAISFIEFILVPGVFLIGLVCYFVGGEKLVPMEKAAERALGVKDFRFAFAPASGGGAAALSFRF